MCWAERNVCYIQGLRLRKPCVLVEMPTESHARVGVLEGGSAHMNRKRQWETRRFNRDPVSPI